MKFALLFALLISFAGAQDKPVTEPEFAGVFVRLNPDGSLTPLEELHTGSLRTSSVVPFRRTMTTNTELPGGKSSVRFHSGESLSFVVKAPWITGMDPNQLYYLRRLHAKKNAREMVAAKVHVGVFASTTFSTGAEGDLPAHFAQYGASSIRVATEALPPGEYAIGQLGMTTVFCFGVD